MKCMEHNHGAVYKVVKAGAEAAPIQAWVSLDSPLTSAQTRPLRPLMSVITNGYTLQTPARPSCTSGPASKPVDL